MSSRNSIHTLSSPSVFYATTTASPRLTKNQSRSTNTTPQSSKATVSQMVSGAYPSIPTFLPPLQGWSTKPQAPLLTSHHTTTCALDLTIHRRHHPRVLVLLMNHATTYVHELTMPPPSPTPTLADLWNTATSLQIPPLATSGYALLPTSSDDLPKAFPTIVSTPPTPSSSYPSPKSHATNAQPTHASYAVSAHRNLKHIAPASQLVVT